MPIGTRRARGILNRLAKIEVLRNLPAEEVHALIPLVAHKKVTKGTQLIKEGDEGDQLFFIESGTARVKRNGSAEAWSVGPGGIVGEASLLTGEARSASVRAETDLSVWRLDEADFRNIIEASPRLRESLERLVVSRLREAPPGGSGPVWVSTALRAFEARSRGLKGWQVVMGAGFLLWAAFFVEEAWPALRFGLPESADAGLHLLCGLFILQGSCEALVAGTERLGARLKWDGFISGTIASLVSTLPEFVVIGFLVRINPLAAFVTAVVTIFNNAIAFSIYSFFLPKDRQGLYKMPRSVTMAGGEILIAGAGIALIMGFFMLTMRIEGSEPALKGFDLIAIGAVLAAIYGYYILTLMRYYREGEDDEESHPPDPELLGHNTGLSAIGWMLALGTAGAYCGGEAIGAFAEDALNRLRLGAIPTAAALAFFAGISEYIIVFKAHRRGELGIALSNVFGGMTQVMFLLLPFAMVLIGGLGLSGRGPGYEIPINVSTMLLVLLLFPLFYTLRQYLEADKISDLAASGMTGIYILLLYFLLTA